MRRSLKRRARRLLLWFFFALVLSWVVALVICTAIDPRRGVVFSSQAWSRNNHTSIQVWRSGASVYAETVRQHNYQRPWGPEQATGLPDTHGQGDVQTAWASATPDAQDEWLKLTWSRPVDAVEISVYQTYNPGAIERITVALADGREETVWSAASDNSFSAANPVLTVPLKKATRIDTVTVVINSSRVAGWNEIDAVCLKDASGSVSGADNVSASSSYADRGVPDPDPSFILPAWSGLETPSGPFERGEVSYERRGAGAFGWPLPAWAATQTIEASATQSPAAMPNGFVSPTIRGGAPAARMRAVPYRPIFPGVVLNSLLYVLILWIVGFVLLRPLRPLRRLSRMQRGHCPGCGYDLRYNFAGGCSECGFMRKS